MTEPHLPGAPHSLWWGAPARVWRSGPWALELRDDEFADISFDGRLALRSVRAVVRDRDWGTAGLVVDRVRETDSTLALHVRSNGLGSSFSGVVRVEARAHALVVIADLETADAFATNRTGLVVLHPPGTAGAALRVTHSDATTEKTAFPTAISPHQPVVDIADMSWASDALEVSIAFDGDVFEMEDQRNWTDASFKTYSRPLALPFPYVLPAGGRVRQTVTIRARVTEEERDAAPTASRIASSRIRLSPGGAFPAIGVGAATAPDPAPEVEPAGAFVLVELDLASTNWRAALDRAARPQTTQAGRPLDVRFVLDAARPAALAEGVGALAGLDVVRVAAFHQVGEARHVSDGEAVTALREALAGAELRTPVVGGSRSHFTELNRERHRIPDDLDGLTVALTPLFHALGTEQLVESLAMQRLVARQTVTLAGTAPVHIGPVCLRPRFNDVATAPQPGPSAGDLRDGCGAQFTGAEDPRQAAPELAAWTVASAAALAAPGVASLSFFEEWGPRGIRTASGEALPAATAIDELSSLTGGELLWGDSPDGLVWAFGSRARGETLVLAANLDRVPRELTVETPDGVAHATLAPASFLRLHPRSLEDTP